MEVNALAGSFGLGFGNLFDFLRTTGLLGAIVGIIILCVKFNLARLFVVEEGTLGLPFQLGKVQYYRRGVKKGRLRRHKPGGYLFIRALKDIIVVSMREIPLKLEQRPVTYNGRTFHFDGTISYEVITDDTPEGDEAILRSVLSVRDADRENQTSAGLDAKVIAIVLHGLKTLLSEAKKDDEEFPILTFEDLEPLVHDELRDQHGLRLAKFHPAPMGWLPVDGIHSVSEKMTGDDRKVIPLPLPESTYETA